MDLYTDINQFMNQFVPEYDFFTFGFKNLYGTTKEDIKQHKLFAKIIENFDSNQLADIDQYLEIAATRDRCDSTNKLLSHDSLNEIAKLAVYLNISKKHNFDIEQYLLLGSKDDNHLLFYREIATTFINGHYYPYLVILINNNDQIADHILDNFESFDSDEQVVLLRALTISTNPKAQDFVIELFSKETISNEWYASTVLHNLLNAPLATIRQVLKLIADNNLLEKYEIVRGFYLDNAKVKIKDDNIAEFSRLQQVINDCIIHDNYDKYFTSGNGYNIYNSMIALAHISKEQAVNYIIDNFNRLDQDAQEYAYQALIFLMKNDLVLFQKKYINFLIFNTNTTSRLGLFFVDFFFTYNQHKLSTDSDYNQENQILIDYIISWIDNGAEDLIYEIPNDYKQVKVKNLKLNQINWILEYLLQFGQATSNEQIIERTYNAIGMYDFYMYPYSQAAIVFFQEDQFTDYHYDAIVSLLCSKRKNNVEYGFYLAKQHVTKFNDQTLASMAMAAKTTKKDLKAKVVELINMLDGNTRLQLKQILIDAKNKNCTEVAAQIN